MASQKVAVCGQAGTEASDEESCKNVAHGAGAAEEVFGGERNKPGDRGADSSHALGPGHFAGVPEGKDDTGSNDFLRTDSQTRRGERGQDSLADCYRTDHCGDSNTKVGLRLVSHPATITFSVTVSSGSMKHARGTL